MEPKSPTMSGQLPVQFVEMLERYPCNEDIECKYSFNNYKVQDGDRIAIFKMGWKSLRNYLLFEWAVDSSTSINAVIFSRYDLPNNQSDVDDLYQFCYISGENVVQGVSTPFQIYSASSRSTVVVADSLKQDNFTHLKHLLSEKDREILKLKEENAILKESLRAMVDQRKFRKTKNCEDDVEELKEVTSKLKNAILGQQKEIDALKIEIKKDKANCRNLMLEKIIAEKKFEAISSKNEAKSVRRLPNFELGNLQSIPDFPLE